MLQEHWSCNVTKEVILLLQYFTYLFGPLFGFYFGYSVLLVRKDKTILGNYFCRNAEQMERPGSLRRLWLWNRKEELISAQAAWQRHLGEGCADCCILKPVSSASACDYKCPWSHTQTVTTSSAPGSHAPGLIASCTLEICFQLGKPLWAKLLRWQDENTTSPEEETEVIDTGGGKTPPSFTFWPHTKIPN